MAKDRKVPEVRRRDWEDPMTVEWNKRNAHVPLHCHTTIVGNVHRKTLILKFWMAIAMCKLDLRVNKCRLDTFSVILL